MPRKPRKPNEHKTNDIKITASSEVVAYLDELAKIGIHGKTRSEVAKVLIGTEIERLIREKILKLRKTSK